MRTAYCPKTHDELAKASAGKPYGHVPGHYYHDAECVISTAGKGTYRVHVVESWGSCQGYDEEHGRREVIGRGESIEQACAEAARRGKEAGMNAEYLTQAVSLAEDEAIENEA